jgi:hypothetical protein
MKTKIGTHKPATSLRIGLADVVNLEMVLMRHITREFKDRNSRPFIKPLQRLDVRDAVKALRTIKTSKLQYHHVD